MANMRLLLVFLLVLPALSSAASSASSFNNCPLTMSQRLLSTGKRYNTYLATILNPSSSTASNIVFSTTSDLKSIDDVDTVGAGYQMDGQTTLKASSTFSFTYQVTSGTNVLWMFTCSTAGTPATTAPTTAPKPTTAPTVAKATTAPTAAKATTATKATTAPTTGKATTAPNKATSAAVPATGGKKCPVGTWWRPRPTTTWQWQLTGAIDTSVDVQMYDIDLFDNDKSVVDKLHAAGRVVICYFSTQYEDWRPDASSWTTAVLGKNLDDWAGEKYVDIRSPVVRNIIAARLDLAVSKGCDGVEPDNVDGYEATTGFPLTAADQLSYNEFIANEAHKRGLSVGLKNDGDQATALQPYFDWALNEQCAQYKECSALDVFIKNNKAVFNCEYSGKGATVCPTQNGLSFSSLIKTLDLTAAITSQCCTFAAGGCTPAAYDCVSS